MYTQETMRGRIRHPYFCLLLCNLIVNPSQVHWVYDRHALQFYYLRFHWLSTRESDSYGHEVMMVTKNLLATRLAWWADEGTISAGMSMAERIWHFYLLCVWLVCYHLKPSCLISSLLPLCLSLRYVRWLILRRRRKKWLIQHLLVSP